MKERPILFSGPMVRALLEGRKTQTRRVCKPAELLSFVVDCGDGQWGDEEGDVLFSCPYGRPGDQLWVRETWYCDDYRCQAGPYRLPDGRTAARMRELGELVYAADGLSPYEQEQPVWRPSIHMPRWASRILLEIVSVRAERLQEISEADAIAEGIERAEDFFGCKCWKSYCEPDGADVVFPDDPIGSYRSLWESINGPDSWDANPWVWVIEFKVMEVRHG